MRAVDGGQEAVEATGETSEAIKYEGPEAGPWTAVVEAVDAEEATVRPGAADSVTTVSGASVPEAVPDTVSTNPVEAVAEVAKVDEAEVGPEAADPATAVPRAAVPAPGPDAVSTTPVEATAEVAEVEEAEVNLEAVDFVTAATGAAMPEAGPDAVVATPVEAIDQDVGDDMMSDGEGVIDAKDRGNEWRVVGKNGRVMACGEGGADEQVSSFSVDEVRGFHIEPCILRTHHSVTPLS